MSSFSCTICFDNLVGALDQYLEEKVPVVFPCGHTFHESCVSEYHERRYNSGMRIEEILDCPICKHQSVCTINHQTNPPTLKYTTLYLNLTEPHLHETTSIPTKPHLRRLMALSKRIAHISKAVDVASENFAFISDGENLDMLSEVALQSYVKSGEQVLKGLEKSCVHQQLKTDIDALAESFNQFMRGNELIKELSRAQDSFDAKLEAAIARAGEKAREEVRAEMVAGYEIRIQHLAESTREAERAAMEWKSLHNVMKTETDKCMVAMRTLKVESNLLSQRCKDMAVEKEKAELSAQAAIARLNEQTKFLAMARLQAEAANKSKQKQADKYIITMKKNEQEIEALRKQIATLKEENTYLRTSVRTRPDRESATPSLNAHSKISARQTSDNFSFWGSGHDDEYKSREMSELEPKHWLEESVLEVEMPALSNSFFDGPDGRERPHPTKRELRIPPRKDRSSHHRSGMTVITSSEPLSSPPNTLNHQAAPTDHMPIFKPLTFSMGANTPRPNAPKTLAARSGVRNNPFSNTTASKKIGKESAYADNHGRIKKGVVSGPSTRFKATR